MTGNAMAVSCADIPVILPMLKIRDNNCISFGLVCNTRNTCTIRANKSNRRPTGSCVKLFQITANHIQFVHRIHKHIYRKERKKTIKLP